MVKTCSKCLFCDLCGGSKTCKHFAPFDDYEDEWIEEEIERRREEFRQEWLVYIYGGQYDA